MCFGRLVCEANKLLNRTLWCVEPIFMHTYTHRDHIGKREKPLAVSLVAVSIPFTHHEIRGRQVIHSTQINDFILIIFWMRMRRSALWVIYIYIYIFSALSLTRTIARRRWRPPTELYWLDEENSHEID